MDDAARRRALRSIARRHHPDLGGDPRAYLEAVEALDRAHLRASRPHGPEVRQRGGLPGLVQLVARRWRSWRASRRAARRRRTDAALWSRRQRPGSGRQR